MNFCEVCEKERDNVEVVPYTFRLKGDTDSIVGELNKGDMITVHLPICKECKEK